MPVILYDLKAQDSLTREPYTTFAKKWKSIESDPDGHRIDIRISGGKEGFSRGFYTDHEYMSDVELSFLFARTAGGVDIGSTFVRMTLSFECNSSNFDYYRDQIKSLKKRVPYYYIPTVSHLEFSSQIDDEFKLQFDAVVPEGTDVAQACYMLINQLIAILSFEN